MKCTTMALVLWKTFAMPAARSACIVAVFTAILHDREYGTARIPGAPGARAGVLEGAGTGPAHAYEGLGRSPYLP